MDTSLFKIFMTIILGFAISYSSLKLKFLSVSGVLPTFILTFIVFFFSDLKWTIPILTFFIFSNLLSKIGKRINPKVNLHSSNAEVGDQYQMLANGGFPGLTLLTNQFLISELFS